MPLNFAQMLVNLGVVPQWAKRFMAAYDGVDGAMDRLDYIGVPEPLSKELSRYIYQGKSNPRRVIELGMTPEQAKLFCAYLTDDPGEMLAFLSTENGEPIFAEDDEYVETYSKA